MEYNKFDLYDRFASDVPSLVAVFSDQSHFDSNIINKVSQIDPVAEIRLDKIVDPSIYNVYRYIDTLADMPIILTNRNKEEGGDWDMEEEFRINNFLSYIDSVDAVDIEIESEYAAKVIDVTQTAGKVAIASFHDFSKEPIKNLDRVSSDLYEKVDIGLEDLGADFVKLAVQVNTIDELNELTKFNCEMVDMPVVVLPMGGLAKAARLFYAVLDSKFTYCSIDNNTVDPGQLNLFQTDKMLMEMDYRYLEYKIKNSIQNPESNLN